MTYVEEPFVSQKQTKLFASACTGLPVHRQYLYLEHKEIGIIYSWYI